MKQYTAKSGKTQFKQSLKVLQQAVLGDTMSGYCLACGEENGPVEPDARKYECDCCGEPKVYGAEELIMMGLYH